MAYVFVTREIAGNPRERLEQAGHTVDIWPSSLPPHPTELRDAVGDAQGLLTMLTDRVDEALLDAAPQLKVIANYAIGFDNIDLSATAARGIQVGVTPDVLTDATADLTFALLLAAARRIPEAAQAVRDGRWRTFETQSWLGADVAHQTIAIVGGAGRIGSAVARRAHGFGMTTLIVGRHDDLHQALQQADFVSLHMPLTPETHHVIDEAALAACKPGAILVNTGRGALVDQHALADALTTGHLAAAALDVTDPEPLPADDPLLRAPNVLVLPHIGSATHTARTAMTTLAVDNLLAGLDDQPLPHPAAAK
jgi:glyoxylate reductase